VYESLNSAFGASLRTRSINLGKFSPATKLLLSPKQEKSKLLGLVLALVCTGIIDARSAENQPYAVPGRYIVLLKQGHKPHEVAGKHGLKPQHVFSHALHGFAGEISAERLESLLQDPRVESIEPELELFSSAQTVPSGVKRIGAALLLSLARLEMC